jgi:myosin heavy subunit
MKKILSICALGGVFLSASATVSAVQFTHASALQPSLAWFGWFKSDKKEEATEAEAKVAEAAEATQAADEEQGGIKVAELRKLAEDTLKTLQSKRGELEKVAALLKEIPLSEQLSAKAREYQGQVSDLTTQINALREQAQGYIAQLEAMGVPVDSLVASMSEALQGASAR